MVSLAEVQACKDFDITPAGFYTLQTSTNFENYQTKLAEKVVRFSNEYDSKTKGIATLFPSYFNEAVASLSDLQLELVERKEKRTRSEEFGLHIKGP